MRNIDDAVKFSIKKLKEIDRNIKFVMGILELTTGHLGDELYNANIVLLEAQEKLFEIHESIEEKLSPEDGDQEEGMKC